MDIMSLKATLSLDSSQYEHALSRAQMLGKEFTRETNKSSDTFLGRAKQATSAFGLLFRSAKKNVDQLPPSINRAQEGFTVLKGIISNLVSGGINLLASSITNNLGGAVSRLDTLKNYSIVMENLGYDANLADAQINRLSEGIEGLPTTLPAIASVQQQFVALGGGLEQATDLTIALNNATLAGGQGQEKANGALQQWYQMIAAGKSDLMSMRIINEAMPAQLDAIAKKVVGADATWQDLHATWQKDPELTDKIKTALLDLNENGYEVAGKKVKAFKDQAIDANKGIQTSITNIKTAIQKGLADTIDNIFGYKQIADTIENFKDAIKNSFKNFNFLVDTAQSDKFGIGYAIQLGAEQAIDALGNLYDQIPKILDKISKEFGKIAKDIDVGAIMDKLVDMVVSKAPTILDKLGQMLNDLAIWLSENGAEVVIKLGEGFIKSLPSIISFMGQVVNAVLKVVIGLPVQLLARGAEAAGAFALGLLKKANEAATAGSKIVGNVVKGLKSLVGRLRSQATAGISAFIGGISKGIGKAKSTATRLASNVINAIKGGISKTADIGLNIVKGIGNGITSGTDWIKRQIKSFVGNVKSFLKNLFGIKSPSTWGRDEIGKMLDAGVAVGIIDNADMVEDAMEDLIPDISSSKFMSGSFATQGANFGSARVVSPIFNTNITVNGAESPESWADRFSSEFMLKARTV